MDIREALMTMAPSLELHRAAADEIARLDFTIARLDGEIERLTALVENHRKVPSLLKASADLVIIPKPTRWP